MAMSLEPAFFRMRSRFVASVAAAWLVACSAGVDSYHVQDKGSHGGAGAGGNGVEDGGATGSGGGEGGDVPSYGGASSGGGTQGGDGGANPGSGGKPRGSGGNGELNTGGAVLVTSGGTTGNGGTGSGGTSSGGAKATGGVSSGGAGGKGSGGIGSGGIGSGGVGTGGAGTGGTGGGPGDPTQVTLSNQSLTGITAAAWDGTFFFLLEATSTTHQFWTVNPANGVVAGPMPLPTGLAPYAFGVSAQGVYVIAANKVYKVSRTAGYTSEAGTAISAMASANGTFGGNYFLIGDLANSGTTKAVATDISGALVSAASGLGAIYSVSTDGSNFGYSTVDTQLGTVVTHHLAGNTLTPNTFGCRAGANGTQNHQVSVYGNTVAWVYGESNFMLLNIVTDTNGSCPVPQPQPIQFGTNAAGPSAVGLINDGDALVVESFTAGTAELQIHGRSGLHKPLTNVYFNGNTQPRSIVVGSGHYAAIVSGYAPAVVRF